MSKPDETVQYRQMHCKHSFIRGMSDREKRCVSCGISENDWEKLKEAQPLFSFNGIT